MGEIFLKKKSSRLLHGAGGESSGEVLDSPLWTGLSREPLSQTPPPLLHGARTTTAPHPPTPPTPPHPPHANLFSPLGVGAGGGGNFVGESGISALCSPFKNPAPLSTPLPQDWQRLHIQSFPHHSVPHLMSHRGRGGGGSCITEGYTSVVHCSWPSVSLCGGGGQALSTRNIPTEDLSNLKGGGSGG